MHYDAIIIGGGPAGLTAGLYLTRGGLKTLLIEKNITGGQAVTTYQVENFPGFPEEITGPELMVRFRQQAENFGLEIISGEVKQPRLGGPRQEIKVNDKEYYAPVAIIASGARPRLLGIPREKDLTGFGISYCATCDGAFFRDKQVMVVGGGNTAVEDALFLARFAAGVKVVHRRDQLRASMVLQKQAFAEPKIEFIWNTVIEAVDGEDTLEQVTIRDVNTGEKKELAIEGLFIAIGIVANTEFLTPQEGLLDDFKYIITDSELQTVLPGVFAAGDVRAKSLRQIVTAASDGAIAAVSAERYLLGQSPPLA